MDLYEDLKQLKDDLLKCKKSCIYDYDEFIKYDFEKIYEIESSLELLNYDEAQKLLVVLKSSTTFKEIYMQITPYIFDDEINEIFVPLLKKMWHQNFNLVVSTVELRTESKKLEISHIRRHIKEMEEAYKNKNFGTVNVISSTVIQSLYKELCLQNNVTPKKGMNDLTEQALSILLMSKEKNKDPILKDFIKNIEDLVRTLNKLRNLYSLGHGTDSATMESYYNLSAHHYYFIMDATKTLCNFFIGSYNFQKRHDSGELEI